ncbi:uncharacterized protein LOC105184518 isoform X1 [Harpegnathos saltator]|uniref:uncharacterized protein LOC105184518 isoform X1 n=1 Tax=Harpegnathos saltator TaxID=610380 RepID=UPI000DBED3DC|nr:uncharacterized protein LOC105184518 isoform X1 [Harpegnathos saltator]XP_025155205.1 uncharacterized protein LOC105184518 isoform X1 [Harpegnathos saltator]
MTEVQINFNNVHAQTRQVIERAFALLKGRFRRLKFLDMNRDDMIPYVIIVSCVLHNICFDVVDDIKDFILEDWEGCSESSFQISRAPHFYVISKNEGALNDFMFVNKHSRIYEPAKETSQIFLSATISSEISLKNGEPKSQFSSCNTILL